MPDYRAMTEAYNITKRSNGNWVIFLCMFFLIVSFAVIVFLSRIIIKQDAELKSIKGNPDSAQTRLPGTSSPILIQDSLKNVILKLNDSLQHTLGTHSPGETQTRWPMNSIVTLYESRWNDTIAIPYNLRKSNEQGDYILNIQLKNILGYPVKVQGVKYNNNPAYKIGINAGSIIDNGANYTITMRLSETDRDRLASASTSPVYVFIDCMTVDNNNQHKTLKFKCIPQW